MQHVKKTAHYVFKVKGTLEDSVTLSLYKGEKKKLGLQIYLNKNEQKRLSKIAGIDMYIVCQKEVPN